MRVILVLALAATATSEVLRQAPAPRTAARPFTVVEASIAELQRAMTEGRTTSRAITEQYLARLSRHNGTLHAAITINPDALAEADARDRARGERTRGPLYGIPIAVKDNIQTLRLPTTGGALAFRTLQAPSEATLVRALRDAGAIIIAKTTLTELANWMAFGMPTGYNALLRYSRNPYDTRDGPSLLAPGVPARLPGGSSSGIGTAASLWAASVGTETSGSILNPSAETMLVGIKPTVGRISRAGVIPIASEQDTPGPMGRSVADAAVLLGALEGAAPDPADPATRACTPPPDRDYTRFLRSDGLKGARIGIPRAAFYDGLSVSVRDSRGLQTSQRAVMNEAIASLRAAGAVIVDPADLPSVTTTIPERNLLAWSICIGPGDALSASCSIVLRYGMKRDFNAWLASLGSAAPVKTLTELRAWNAAHRTDGAIEFGQEQLDASDAIDLVRDAERYRRDREKDLRLTRDEGLDAALTAHRLDALLFPSYFGAAVGARAGYPSIIVPFSLRTDAAAPQSFGVTFTGPACSEPRLITLAYAFEQATRRRVPPRLD